MNNEEFAEAFGFLPAVRVDNLIFFSGVIGIKEDGSVPTDPEEQYRLVFASLAEALKGQGLTKENLVDLLTFHAQYPNHMDSFMAIKAEFLGDTKTAWTAIGAAALGTPETLVEVKATARIA